MKQQVHITRNGRILCHAQNAGLVLTVDFQEATSWVVTELCPDCYRRHHNICAMIGANKPLKSTREIGAVEKHLILDRMRSESIFEPKY